MQQQRNKGKAAAKRLLDLYNLLINLFWSTLGFVPVIVFCYRFVPVQWLIIFLIPSLLALLLPGSIVYKMQLAQSTKIYKRLGVPLVNKFSQNGSFIQGLIKRRFPKYRILAPSRSSVPQLLRQTILFEKFHFATALFFVLITLLALFKHLLNWAVGLTVINLVYNIYPILFQQYVRLKLRVFLERERKVKVNKTRPDCGRLFASWAK